MKFEIRVCQAETASKSKAAFTNVFSDSYLKYFFLNKNYGIDIEHIVIFIILIRTRPGYEEWYKPKKPRYVEYDSWYTPGPDGAILNEHKKCFMIEIRFDGDLFDDFIDADDERAKHILARESLKALDLLDKRPKRLKHFDKVRFKNDVATYYHEQGWI